MSKKETVVFCDKCGACSNSVYIIVTHKKARCYSHLISAGMQQMLNEKSMDDCIEAVAKVRG